MPGESGTNRPSGREDLSGSLVSHYQVLERVGSGGMGVVYKARDTRLQRFVALKFLPPQLSSDETSRARFVEEARSASALDHPHVCTIFDIGEMDGGGMFIAMAYCPGESLKQRIARGRLGAAEAIDIAVQISEGLIEAHEHGIVHRDIKPANILIGHDGNVRIVDFGLATLVGLVLDHAPNTLMGTLAYMSPEQIRAEPVDHRSDIWSLGVTLYEMLAGRPPFGSDEGEPLLYRIEYEPPPPLAHACPEIPDAILAVLDVCLAKDRRQRYRTAADLRAALLAARTTPLAPSALPPRRPTALLRRLFAALRR